MSDLAMNAVPGRSFLLLLVLLIVLSLSCAMAKAEERLALLIGNSRYDHVTPLRNPENDIGLVAQALETAGFSTQVIANLKREELAAIDGFVAKVAAKPGAVVLIYYSGHGVQIGGHNFILPTDVAVDQREALAESAVAVDEVLKKLASVQSSLQMLILDACRDEPFGPADRGILHGLGATSADRTGRLIAYSTAPGKTATDGDSGTSPYAGALAETILIPGLRLEDVFARVRSKVLERTNSAQEPWESAALNETPFYFVQGTGKTEVDDVEQHTGILRRSLAPPRASSAIWKSSPTVGSPSRPRCGSRRTTRTRPSFAGTRRFPLSPRMPKRSGSAGTPGQVTRSFWAHNGSLMAFAKGGTRREISYWHPRDSLRSAEVESGTVLFDGVSPDGKSYSGFASVISARCPGNGYPVEGSVSDNGHTIVLEGDAPVLDADCAVVGQRHDELLFQFVGRADSIDPDSIDLADLPSAE